MRTLRVSLLFVAAIALTTWGIRSWMVVDAPDNMLNTPRDLAAAPGKPGPDPFGYSTAFDLEIQKLGQISTTQFAERYPSPPYQPAISWNPTTARFFDKLHVEKVVKEPYLNAFLAANPQLLPQHVDMIAKLKQVELSGYKLNDDELAKYKQHGFVVSERLGGKSFGQVYYDVYSRDLPVFITSDSVLHAWHRSYDAMLEELELFFLMPSLDAILTGMHESVPAANEQYGAGVLKESVQDADFFLAVGRSLLKGSAIPTKLGQDERVKQTLAAIQAEQMHEFPLFGRKRNMDFSQFKPRGRYENHWALRYYFKAMMWCGRTDLRIAGGYDWTGPLSAPRELGTAVLLLDLLRKGGKEEAWRQFDRTLQTYVGRTDSATFDDLARIAAAAKVSSPADLKTDADFERLTQVVLDSDAGKQNIRGDIYISPYPRVKVTLPRSFTLMGQKFAVDSWVTSKVVFDDIMWDGSKVNRRVPSGLDVAFAALGNNHVVPDIVERIENGPDLRRDRKPYQHNLAAVRSIIDDQDPKVWDETIYTSWLKSLRTLSTPAEASLPEAIRTRAWAMKQTNTQMASWTQLRHDTILYVKQSYSVCECYYPSGFVEPVVPFWAAMEEMARLSAELIERTPFPPTMQIVQTRQTKFLRHFAAQMVRLKTVAEKQRDQKELTADERKVLEDVMQFEHIRIGSGGQTTERCTGWYPSLFYREPRDCMTWDAIVADVHTDPGSSILHQGVGSVDLIVIAINNGQDHVVYAGPTFSHYEFEMPGAARKTDREWKTDLLDAKHPPRPEWTRSYLVPQADRKPAAVAEKIRWLHQ